MSHEHSFFWVNLSLFFLKEKGRKGQSLTPDFMLSMAIFLALFVFGTFLWVITYSSGTTTQNFESANLQISDIAETLVRSQGNPTNWTNDTVVIIGLAKEDHLLDENKLIELEKVTYANMKKSLGIQKEDINITIQNITGAVIKSYGLPIDSLSKNIVPIDRTAVLEYNSGKRELVIVKVRLWYS